MVIHPSSMPVTSIISIDSSYYRDSKRADQHPESSFCSFCDSSSVLSVIPARLPSRMHLPQLPRLHVTSIAKSSESFCARDRPFKSA